MPTVKDIVIDFLKVNGFQGLRFEECGCGIDDICPCDESGWDCEPAYKKTCKREGCKDKEICDGEDGGDCFTTVKPDVIKRGSCR